MSCVPLDLEPANSGQKGGALASSDAGRVVEARERLEAIDVLLIPRGIQATRGIAELYAGYPIFLGFKEEATTMHQAAPHRRQVRLSIDQRFSNDQEDK